MQGKKDFVSILVLVAAQLGVVNAADANPYQECMLDRALMLREANTDAIDAIAEACIKKSERPLDSTEAAKVEVNFLYGEMVRGMGSLGLIIQIYNGSSFDITSLTVRLTDKQTKVQRQYQRDVWYSYNRGPGMVTSYGPRHKNRFIKSLTSGEYMFPIGTIDVPQEDFFKRYDVAPASALGVR
jgi:hypothetical protein